MTAEPRLATPAVEGAPPPPAARAFFVGIGSSAGGLEALTALLPGLPAGLGLRYVVVQHMSPTHRSMMAHLLSRISSLEVLEVVDGCVPEPDKVYVTPPNHNVVLAEDGRLRLLTPPNETVPKPSVNLFFNSLAESVGDRSIGVVLSGTGSDGAIGLHAIKAAGGYAFAQEPGGAKYDGMVRAAIEAGGVDWVLPAESMGAEIVRIVQRQLSADGSATHVQAMPPATLQALLHSLYAQTRIDFTGYKEATLLRRIERRMTSTGCLTLDQYVEHTRAQPAELHTLAQDMLISVTSFFRDRLAFDRLRDELVRLIQVKPPGDDLRIWVAGCASGEEAYSIAILLHDILSGLSRPQRLQIFASDIDENALARARRAVYPASLLCELDPSTLERHFTPHAEGFEVNKALRAHVMFARHNLVQDPPFVRLDLISCRNVLIYLQTTLQERLMRTFQYALQPGGLLFLGRSEGTHGSEGAFETVDAAAHLYRRGQGAGPMPPPGSDHERSRTAGRPPRTSMEEVAMQALAPRFLPACVLVDEAGDVRHFKGDLQGIMALPEGRPGFQLMSLLRRELRAELARLMRGARESQRPAPAPGQAWAGPAAPPVILGRWRNNRAISQEWALRQSVQKMKDEGAHALLLVCFERRPLQELAALPLPEGSEGALQVHTALEEELATTREHLHTVIEELETSNEEAQSLNEEIQTANEELQATNEELEASNEELQASNEELTTVNEELQVKSLEWQAMTLELEGLYATVDFPLMAFDERFVLTRINRAVQRQLGMDASWLGKPAASLPWPEGMPPLLADFELAQAQGHSLARQLSQVSGRQWALRIMPRVGGDGSRLGVLLQMEDNTRLRESEGAAMRSDAQLRQLVARSAQLVCICDPVGRLQMANPEFERHYGLTPGSALGCLVDDLLPRAQARAFRDARLEAMRTLAPKEVEETVEVEGERRDLLASYYPLLDDDGAVSGVCYQALDITRRKKAETALLAAHSAKLAAESMARTKAGFLANMSHEIRTPMNAVLGLSRMALEAELPLAAREQISKVHEAARALTRILDDVLDFSKIEAGELHFEQRPFQLDRLLASTKSLFSANAQEKGLQLLLEMPFGVPNELLGDSLRLSQVLNNLVGNALKFTERGEVRLSASSIEDERPGWCSLRFVVRDTGIGIAPHLLETLFEAFTQGDPSVTRRFGGTGLGLAICRRLVDLMGGRIGVSSEPGKGSEFWFTAGFRVAPQAASSEPTGTAAGLSLGEATVPAAEPGLRAFEQVFGGGLVLLAEDNPLNQIVGQAVLEGAGLRVDIAQNGEEALALLSRQPAGHYRAVFMDMHMPVMDGLEATRRLRALPQGRGLPVIALTAAALSEDRERCLSAGMDGHIAKPLEPQDLLDTLRRLALHRLGQADHPAASEPATPEEHGSAALPQVAGFDLQPLLESLQNNRQVVWRLLEEFVDREGVTAEEISRLVADRRLEEARFRTHALVGSAITVGATLVARTAAGLESALGAGVASPAMVQSVQEALQLNLAAASQALKQRTVR